MHSYLASAIVSTYKAERFIKGCLEDLLGQTLGDKLEIVVVDSGSPESEREIVQEYMRQHNNIRYIRTEKRETIYEAWNRGVLESKGRYITNANSDDRHAPNSLERMVAVLDGNNDIGLVYADCYITENENETWASKNVVGIFHWPVFDPTLLFKVSYIGPQPMWRRSLHEKYGLFDGTMKSAGDYEYWLRLAAAGVEFKHIPETLGLYLASPFGIELSNLSRSEIEADIARKRYWPRKSGEIPLAGGTFKFPALSELPLISVVMPTLNRHGMLKDALGSLLKQQYKNWEAIIVNDGGEDAEQEIISMDSRKRIRYLRHFTRFGQAAARNTALRVARGEIIVYLDDDDFFKPEHLQNIVRAMKSAGTPFVFTGAEKVDERIVCGERIELARFDFYKSAVHGREDLMVKNRIPINAWAHKIQCLDRVGFFDENMASHEDWDFLLRVSRYWDMGMVPGNTAEIRNRVDLGDSVTKRQKRNHYHDYCIVYERNPTGCKSLLRERNKVLAEESNAPLGLIARASVKARLLLDRYVTWRF